MIVIVMIESIVVAMMLIDGAREKVLVCLVQPIIIWITTNAVGICVFDYGRMMTILARTIVNTITTNKITIIITTTTSTVAMIVDDDVVVVVGHDSVAVGADMVGVIVVAMVGVVVAVGGGG